MKSLSAIFIAAVVGLAHPLFADELGSNQPSTYMGRLFEETEIFGRAKWEAARETGAGKMQKNEQNIDVELKTGLSDEASIKTIIRGIRESHMETKNLSDIDLREFYLDLDREWGKVRLGRQQVVWGKMDGLKLLDLINPQDFREFILDDFIDSRIPLWMIRSDLYVGDDTLQLLIIPDVRAHKLASSGDRFEPAWLKTTRAIPQPHIKEESPEDNLSNAEVGIRYSGFAGGWDYSLNYFYSWEDNPLFFNETVAGVPSIVRKHKRTKMTGGSFSRAFGYFVFRGELAYNMDKYFTTTSPTRPTGQVKKDELKGAIGLDYSKGDWMFTGQIFDAYITDWENGLVNERHTTQASMLVTLNLFNETLELRLQDIYGIDESDNLTRFSATYEMTDKWQIKGGFSIFNGPSDSFIGQFSDADRIEAELIYNF